MKKSEKVEIRVSLHEKETLTRLAELEGTSVSALVRNLVRKYVAINSNQTRKKSLILSSALVAFGAIVGALFVGLQTPSNSGGYYFVEGTIEDSAFGFPFSPVTDKLHVLTLSTGERLSRQPYRLEVSPIENNTLLVQVCKVSGDRCEVTTYWEVDLDPRTPSVFQTVGPNEEYIFMSIQKMTS